MAVPVSSLPPLSIAGAGPAGLTAATLLARAGRRVVVHERNATVGARFVGDLQVIEDASDPAETVPARVPYSLPLVQHGDGLVADWAPLLGAVLADRAAGVAVPEIAARFHAALAALASAVAARVGALRVVLAGGCFQNRRLLDETRAALENGGLAVFWPQRLPPGDGGLAVGQAAVAQARLAAKVH